MQGMEGKEGRYESAAPKGRPSSGKGEAGPDCIQSMQSKLVRYFFAGVHTEELNVSR